jgi:hypothetical protein
MFIVSAVYMIGEKAADAILAAAGQAKVPQCIYGQGFWCKVWNALAGVGRCAACALAALAPAAKVLAAVVGVLLLALIGTVAVSWFITEPPSENPDLTKEAQTVQQIVQLLNAKVTKQYAKPHVLRDIHPKANACVKANVTVVPNLPPDLRIGFLNGKPNGDMTYKAWIRFSNAADVVTADTTRDFRGMSVKLFGVAGDRLPVPGNDDDSQDLLFIGNDAFSAGGPQDFLDYFTACNKGGGSCSPRRNPYVAWDLITHPRAAYNLLSGRRAYPTIGDIQWFSVAPFRLGDGIVKYAAFPCWQQAQYGRPGSTPYYLQQRLFELLDPANNNHLCLTLNVQQRHDAKTQSVENTLVAWREQTSPWRKVATIDVYPQIFSSTGQQEFCERLTFNPWDGLQAHRPEGGLNRARRDVMQVMQDARLKADGLTRFGPHELTGNENFN